MPAVVIHGGGPTPVSNAWLAGLARVWRTATSDPLLGAVRGVEGVLKGEYCDLGPVREELWARLQAMGGSALGSSRLPESSEEILRLVTELENKGVHTLFVAGGDRTMQSASRLAEFAGMMRVIALPVTVQNDVCGTHHTPGYGSCARYFAQAVRDAAEENRGAPWPVVIVETLGRESGWPAAATALARQGEDDAPHRIWTPERPVELDRMVSEMKAITAELGQCVVAVSEGLGVGSQLAAAVTEKTGLPARCDRPGLSARSNSSHVSARDRQDALRCGEAAARAAFAGARGVAVVLTGVEGTGLESLDAVADGRRAMPTEFLDASGGDVSDAFLDYVRPLAGVLDEPARLR